MTLRGKSPNWSPAAGWVPCSPVTDVHLVRVSERTKEDQGPSQEVREAVKREWYGARSKEVVDSTYSKLRGKYSIVIEDPHARAAAKPRTEGVATATRQP